MLNYQKRNSREWISFIQIKTAHFQNQYQTIFKARQKDQLGGAQT
jgi:hypothetical protein